MIKSPLPPSIRKVNLIADVKLRKEKARIYFHKNRLVGTKGDSTLIKIIQASFKEPIDVISKKTKKKRVVEPGQRGYVRAVLKKRIQFEFGIVVKIKD